MSNNQNLQTAKNSRFDEFYTAKHTIEIELPYYKEYFNGKTVLCNCNDAESNFHRFFKRHFNEFGLRKLISTQMTPPLLIEQNSKQIVMPLNSGDFRSAECIELLKQADVVVTNPPFSLFREYIAMLVKYQKKFLIIGNINALKYKEIFPLFKERKMWLGVTSGTREFEVPDDFEKGNVYEKDGKKYAKFGNTCWFTNLEHHQQSFRTLTATYNEKDYPKYDNYDAIDVSRVTAIPYDYKGVMGVPITIMQNIHPEQFEIVGEFNHGCDNEYDLAVPSINKKKLFPRIAIRNKKI